MRCLILKLQGPKHEKCRLYRTKRYINYNDALRPNILVVWGALCGYVAVRTFQFKTVLILIGAFSRLVGTSTSYTFLCFFAIFSYMVQALTFVTLCHLGGSPITLTSNTDSTKIDSTI